MKTLRSLRHAVVAFFAFALIAIGATDAHATHFRYGTIRWSKTSETGTTVTLLVTTESAWRCTFFNQPCASLPTTVVTGQTVMAQRLSDNVQLGPAQSLDVLRSAINPAEDWFVGSSTHTFVLNKADLPARIFWQGTNRLSNIRDNNGDIAFRVEARIGTTPNAASPAASILPIITVGRGPAVKFFIPAGDIEGDTLTWSIPPTTRSALTKAAPDGSDDLPPATLSINPTTGEVTWNTLAEIAPPSTPPQTDLYAVQFLVTDGKGGETPVDALLRIVSDTGTPPQALIEGVNSAYTVFVRPNNPVEFTVTGSDNDAGATVTLTSGALPPGATMTPSLPTTRSSPVNSTFRWTPTLAQSNTSWQVSFSATDNFGNQDQNSATINVLNNLRPLAACIPSVSVEATSATGASVTTSTTVSDPDGDALTVRWFVDTNPVPVQTDTVPAGGGSTTLSLTHVYAIGPHTLRVEASDGLATSTVCVPATTITVIDAPPVVTVPNTTAEATSGTGAVVTFVATALDVVDGPIATVNCVPASGSTFPLGATLVTCTATDLHGHTGTGTGTVTVVDTTRPEITVPADFAVEATSPLGAVVTYTATAFDTVDGSIVPTCVPASGTTFAIFNPHAPITVRCNAVDAHGNPAIERIFRITVQDTTRPVIPAMANVVVEATSAAGASATWITPNATDEVDVTVAVACLPASGSSFPLFNPQAPVTVRCNATDAHGNHALERTFTVTVVDTRPPDVTVPNITVEATTPNTVVDFVATAVDIVDGNITAIDCVPPSGSTFPLGVTPVHCTATDAHGNQGKGVGSVTVVDTQGPVLTLPAPIVEEATASNGNIVMFTATAMDAGQGPVPVTCIPDSGFRFPVQLTTVNCSASDAQGHTTTGSFTVTIQDTTPPDITVPASFSVEATGSTGAVVTYTATATDIVDGSVTPSCEPESGTLFALFNPAAPITVTCNAVDAHGNHATPRTFTVTVVDTRPPVVTVPDTTQEATSPAGAVVTFVATAFDIVDGNLNPTCLPPSGSTFPLGATVVHCTANDAHGNHGEGTGTVTVVDTQGPVLTLPDPIVQEATAANGNIVMFTATAMDAGQGSVPVTCNPASGVRFPIQVTTVNCSASDGQGHTTNGSFTVTIRDTTPPVITVPANIVREATGPTGAVVTYTATATDIVDGNTVPTCVLPSGSTFAIFNPEAPITVRCNATDAHGNPAIEQTFTVTVRDRTAPDIHNMRGNITASPTSPAGAVVTWPAPNATDIVDVTVNVVCTPASGSLFPLGVTPVTCRATDAHGNTSSASFTVRVADSTPPVVTVTLNPGALWPPDHKMVNVSVTVRTADNDPNPSCVITKVTSNQPINGTGDGDTDVDWAFNGLTLKLRRERAGNAGKDAVRIYTVTVACTDSNGNVGSGTGTARVVHDQGNDNAGFMGLNLK